MPELPIGIALYQARRHQKLSQEEVASRAGVHRNCVSRIETGTHQPSLAHFVALSEAIGESAPKILSFAYKLQAEQGASSMSRPKKVILLVDSNERTLSTQRFVLENWNYRVLAAGSAKEAVAILAEAQPLSIDLMMCRLLLGSGNGNDLVILARTMRPEMRSLLFCDKTTNLDSPHSADSFVPKGAFFPHEIKDRIRILVARKRGPRKVPATAAPTSEGWSKSA